MQLLEELPTQFYEEGFDATRYVMSGVGVVSDQGHISTYRTRKYLELAAVYLWRQRKKTEYCVERGLSDIEVHIEVHMEEHMEEHEELLSTHP